MDFVRKAAQRFQQVTSAPDFRRKGVVFLMGTSVLTTLITQDSFKAQWDQMNSDQPISHPRRH